MQITLLLQWALEPEARSRTTIPAAALTVADAFAIVALSLYEHTHSIRPSILLETYLFFTLLFDVVRCRTLWLLDADKTAAALFTASVGLKVIVVVLEACEKHGSWIRPEDVSRSREEKSGAFGQALFSWLVHLIHTGYGKVLSLTDLYPLAHDMQSEIVGARFDYYWIRSKSFTVRCEL